MARDTEQSEREPQEDDTHNKSLPPLKIKKIKRKKKLEKIRKNRQVTIIQAQWRGIQTRKVYPLDKHHHNSQRFDSKEEGDKKRGSQESNQSFDEKEVSDKSRGNQTSDVEGKKENEIDDRKSKQRITVLVDSKPDGADEQEDVEKPGLERKHTQMIHSENLMSIAKKHGGDGDGSVNYAKEGIAALVILSTYFCFGTVFYAKTLKISYFRAFYFSVITVTTIGYGEISPDTDFTKMVTVVNIFIGLALFTIAITFLLDYMAKKKEEYDNAVIAKKFEEENRIEMEVRNSAENKEEKGSLLKKNETTPHVASSKLCGPVLEMLSTCLDCLPHQIKDALHNIIVAVAIICATVFTGAIFFSFVVADMTFVDSIYFSSVTTSSVGYGDLLPETDRARAFIVVYGIIGTGMVANALSKFSSGISLLINYDSSLEDDEEEEELGDEVFKLMDSDGDGKVVKAEFMLYKLVRMGLVKPEHLKNCSDQFARLDFDGNGYLSQDDVEEFSRAVSKNKKKKKKKGQGRRNQREDSNFSDSFSGQNT